MVLARTNPYADSYSDRYIGSFSGNGSSGHGTMASYIQGWRISYSHSENLSFSSMI
jgi:hypothetical protein